MLQEILASESESVNGRARSGAESARRAIAVLLAFADHPTMSPRDAAAVASIPLPSIYRYLALLREEGLLLCDENTGLHRLSAKVLALAHAAERAEPLVDLCRPTMIRLAAECKESVQLMRLEGRSVTCVHRIESSHNLRISSEPGHSLPPGRGASSRLLLGSLAPEVRRAWLVGANAEEIGEAAWGEQEIFEADRNGWAVSEEEVDRGIWAVAAAIRKGSATVATLTVLSPLVRAPAEQQERLIRQVRDAAGEINSILAR